MESLYSPLRSNVPDIWSVSEEVIFISSTNAAYVWHFSYIMLLMTLIMSISISGNLDIVLMSGRFYFLNFHFREPPVEMSSLLRTDPEVYDDKKQKHLKRFHSKVVTKIELN
jgi:hypothetical protein